MHDNKPNLFGWLLNLVGTGLMVIAIIVGIIESVTEYSNTVEEVIVGAIATSLLLRIFLAGLVFKVFGKILMILVDIELNTRQDKYTEEG